MRAGWTHCWVLRKRAERIEGPPAAGSHGGLILVGRSASCRAMLCIWTCSGCVGGCCLLFEICIVDASIFVAKFFRAHGGCLGIRSR
jgi:hypothetical protein